jgi:hypothetical protein
MKYVCALTGAVEQGIVPEDYRGPRDTLDTAPLGWTRVTIERRVPNPTWISISMSKDGQLEQLATQLRAQGVPEAVVQAQYAIASIALDATFYALEKDTPPFLVARETVWISADPDARAVWNEARSILAVPELSEAEWALDELDVPEDSTPSAQADEQA